MQTVRRARSRLPTGGAGQAELSGRLFEDTKYDTRVQTGVERPEGAQELYEAYKKSDLRVEDFEGPRFKRIDHIKMLMATGKLDTSLRWREAKPA